MAYCMISNFPSISILKIFNLCPVHISALSYKTSSYINSCIKIFAFQNWKSMYICRSKPIIKSNRNFWLIKRREIREERSAADTPLSAKSKTLKANIIGNKIDLIFLISFFITVCFFYVLECSADYITLLREKSSTCY
jgi:hypothetical protein